MRNDGGIVSAGQLKATRNPGRAQPSRRAYLWHSSGRTVPPRRSSISTLVSTCVLRRRRCILPCRCRTLRPVAPHEPPSFDISGEERLLQDIVDEMLMQGVWITCSSRLCGHEPFRARSNIRLAVTATLSPKVCERAASVIRAAVTKVLAKRRRLHLRTPEISSLYYAIPVHIACRSYILQ